MGAVSLFLSQAGVEYSGEILQARKISTKYNDILLQQFLIKKILKITKIILILYGKPVAFNGQLYTTS